MCSKVQETTRWMLLHHHAAAWENGEGVVNIERGESGGLAVVRVAVDPYPSAVSVRMSHSRPRQNRRDTMSCRFCCYGDLYCRSRYHYSLASYSL